MQLGTSDLAPWESFSLQWRFEPPYSENFPVEHIAPLASGAAARLHATLSPLEHNFVFAPKVRQLEQFEIPDDGARVSEWIVSRPINPDNVLLSWNAETAVQVPWSLLVSNWHDFWYPSSDNLSVVDHSLSFLLLFAHFERVYFGVIAP
jgi:hypothetical protein